MPLDVSRCLSCSLASLALIAAASTESGAATNELRFAETTSALTLDSFEGDIEVRGGRDTQVLIKASAVDWDSSCTLVSTEEKGVASVQVRRTKRRDRCETRFVVTAPQDLALSLSLGAGDVRLSDLRGHAALEIGAGDLTLSELRGALDIELGAGNLTGSSSGALDLEACPQLAPVRAPPRRAMAAAPSRTQ